MEEFNNYARPDSFVVTMGNLPNREVLEKISGIERVEMLTENCCRVFFSGSQDILEQVVRESVLQEWHLRELPWSENLWILFLHSCQIKIEIESMIYQIAKNELRNMFYSPIAWLVLFIFAVQTGIEFTGSMAMEVRDSVMGIGLYRVTANCYSGIRGLFSSLQVPCFCMFRY